MFGPSKVLGFLALPSNLLIALALVGILLMRTRFHRFGMGLLMGAVILLAVIGITPVGNALMLPLEERFPKWEPRGGAPHGIIVLGGAVSPDVSAARKDIALNEAAERMTAVAKFARDHPDAKIVFTGGSGRLFEGASEADFVHALFESFGIGRHRVALEDKARNTAENATFTKALVQPKPSERWLLVTSAHHMPRSVGLFRKAGFPVEAYPVDFRTRGTADLTGPFGSLAAGLARTDAAMHEWAGLKLLAEWAHQRIVPGTRFRCRLRHRQGALPALTGPALTSRYGYQIENILPDTPPPSGAGVAVMRIETRVIPVEGISEIPDIVQDLADNETLQRKRELLLLSIATGLSVLLVSCAWVAIAFD